LTLLVEDTLIQKWVTTSPNQHLSKKKTTKKMSDVVSIIIMTTLTSTPFETNV